MAEFEMGGDHPEATSEHKPKGKFGKLFHGKRGVLILIGAVAVVVFGYLLIRRSASSANSTVAGVTSTGIPNPSGSAVTSSDAFQTEGIQSQLGNLTDQMATEFQQLQNELANQNAGNQSASNTQSNSKLVSITPTIQPPTAPPAAPPQYFAFSNFEQGLAAHNAGVAEYFSPAPGIYEPIDITQSHFSKPTPIYARVPTQ